MFWTAFEKKVSSSANKHQAVTVIFLKVSEFILIKGLLNVLYLITKLEIWNKARERERKESVYSHGCTVLWVSYFPLKINVCSVTSHQNHTRTKYIICNIVENNYFGPFFNLNNCGRLTKRYVCFAYICCMQAIKTQWIVTRWRKILL